MGEKQERTAAEILEENALEMAATRFVAKRFKDAIRRDRQWTSKSVDVNTAKGVAVSFNSQGDAKVHLYVTLTPKGKEPIRVYAPEAEQLNQFSVASFMQKHGALLLKDLRLSVRGQKPA